MNDPLFRRVAEAMEAVSEEDREALSTLDGSEAERIESRRRYEEFVDLPITPDPLSTA